MFSLWNTSLDKIESFVKKANNFHSTIKFTAEMSETEIMFLDKSKSMHESQVNIYHEASVTSYVYEIRPKIRGPFDGC